MRGLITSGALVTGTSLPSVRQLAGDLGVNLNTIARAYRLLEDEGFLDIRGRSGVKVAPPAEKVEDAAHSKLLEQLRITLARFRQCGVTNNELMEVARQALRRFEIRGTEDSDA
ncbi:MAG: GntR family transcriptional regulator [Gemmatimonadota bacterium]